MIIFFKSNDPFRFLAFFIISILIMIPVIFIGDYNPEYTVFFKVLGNKINNGHLLYRDITDNTEPLSALVFMFLSMLKPEFQHWISYLIVFLIVLINTLLFNNMCYKNELYLKQNFVPGFCFLLSMILFMDFLTINPALLSITFLVMGLNKALSSIKTENIDTNVYGAGFYIGIASMFYLPSILYVPVFFLGFLLFTRTSFRMYLLFTWGLIFPIIMVTTFFFWNDSADVFFENIFQFGKNYEDEYSLEFILYSISPVVIFIIFAGMKLSGARRFIAYQTNIILMMILLGGVFIFYFITQGNFQIFSLILVVPVIAYFLAHYFSLLDRPFLANTLSVLMLLFYLVKLSFNSMFFNPIMVDKYLDLKLSKSDRVFVLGKNNKVLEKTTHATTFLNWKMSQKILNDLNKYSNVEIAYKRINEDLPNIIIDESDLAKKMFFRLPFLQNNYQKHNKYSNVYILKNI